MLNPVLRATLASAVFVTAFALSSRADATLVSNPARPFRSNQSVPARYFPIGWGLPSGLRAISPLSLPFAPSTRSLPP
jgi:hypothetical protein